MIRSRTVTAAAILLAATAARSATLAEGGFASRRPAPRAGAPHVDDGSFALRRLLEVGPRPVVGDATGRPKALGDQLILSVDDGFAPVDGAWESRLAVRDGAAGPTDAIAVRFPSQALAIAPPFDVTSAIVGLDDRWGATTWPVEAWLEDATTPLQPRRGGVSASATLDAVAGGLTPTTGPRPTRFERLRADLRLSVPDSWLTDGAFDDDFDRTATPLADENWVECTDGTCGTTNAFISGNQVVRQAGGGAMLAVRFPGVPQEAMRPHRDLDLKASVRVAVVGATARRAGLALRIVASDTYYRVEYQPGLSQVVVSAVLPTPIGAVPVGAPLPWTPATSGFHRLEVTVHGTTPAVVFDVAMDGTPIGSVSDATWRLTGWYAGLSASDPTSQGEAWDDFVVQRRPDVFAVLGVPAGADAGLPLDVSDRSLASQSVLLSSDGATFAPLGPETGCANPGNPFVQLRVDDAVAGDRLFRHEAHVVAVEFDCPTCPAGPVLCPRNLGVTDRPVVQLTTGAAVTVGARWWNEGLDGDQIILRGTLWSGPCSGPGAQIVSGETVGIASTGQVGSPVMGASDVFTFTPADPGPQCIVIEELHDTNGDCCPDGEETTPLGGCAGACTPIAATDSNPSTRWVLVDVDVADPCAGKTEDVGRDGPDDTNGDRVPDEINLDGASLRVSKGAGDAVSLSWARHDDLVFPAIYDVHVAQEATFWRGACWLDQAPVAQRVVGSTSVGLDVVAPLGRAAWISVEETDGCPSGADVPDDSVDDPGLKCP